LGVLVFVLELRFQGVCVLHFETEPHLQGERFMNSDTAAMYRGTSLIRNCLLLGPYIRPIPRGLWWSYGGG
jgi:hypothetical protein